MGLDSFMKRGVEQVKKGARIGATGLALTGGVNINAPIPAEIEAAREEIARVVADGVLLRGTIAPGAELRGTSASAPEQHASAEQKEQEQRVD